jgi:uncharacterized protein (DUF427 family)
MKAMLAGTVIATSTRTVEVDGYHYFPAETVDMKLLKPSTLSTFCPFKGRAKYWDVVVGEVVHANAAFSYPEPKEDMGHLAGRIAFWPDGKGVKVA